MIVLVDTRRDTDYQLAVTLMAAVYETTPKFSASILLVRRRLGFAFAFRFCGIGEISKAF